MHFNSETKATTHVEYYQHTNFVALAYWETGNIESILMELFVDKTSQQSYLHAFPKLCLQDNFNKKDFCKVELFVIPQH